MIIRCNKSNGNFNVIKTEHENDYTVINNNVFRNKALTFKAKGLLCLILSLPSNWKFTVAGLAGLADNGTDSIKMGLKELEQNGYFEKENRRLDNGQLKTIYTFREIPIKSTRRGA